jgi:hypothetical protein
MRATGPLVVGALLTLGGLAGCLSVEAPGPTSVVSPAVPFLTVEVDRAARAVDEAREALPADGVRANEALGEAEAALARLQFYYLPLLEARQRASNARQLAANGDLGGAEAELGHIETTLLGLARSLGGEMGRQVEEPLALLEDARVALARSSPGAPARLEELAERLELMLLKGELVLG